MTRTARNRFNSLLHQSLQRPLRNQPPAARLQRPSQRPRMQPSFLQRNPLLAGIAGGLAGSWLGHMLFGATDSSAKTNEAGEHVGATDQAAGSPRLHRDSSPPDAPGSRGALLFSESAAARP